MLFMILCAITHRLGLFWASPTPSRLARLARLATHRSSGERNLEKYWEAHSLILPMSSVGTN